MLDHIEKYTSKLLSDRAALPGFIAIAAQDDCLVSAGEPQLAVLAEAVLSRLNALALVTARPSLPFADLLVRRSAADARVLVPSDTETRTFLHDIPFVRLAELGENPAPQLAVLLGSRKGIIVEGVGILAVGALTVEQAYINYSSVFHSAFVKYLQDLLIDGFRLPGEEEGFRRFRDEWLLQLSAEGLEFRQGPLTGGDAIIEEVARVGKYTVERGLVDSFFGNISCRDGNIIYISQTSASLDELPGCIDPVPLDNSSTAGITASSELLAHRRMYEATGAKVILHGHPKFSVVMSMICEEGGCGITDCWKDCPKVRLLGDVPVVAGEIGAGGLAKRVAPVIGRTGQAVVYGHGVFALGYDDFREAFEGLVAVENYSREEYFRRLTGKFAS